jgi:GNAT superfamily N-acetyltransferase
MSHLAVHPQARGHGLGGALLREFMNHSRAADSQWLMLHPAECGANGALPPAMQRLCEHAGMCFVEALAEHRRHRPTLMAVPAYHFRAASHVPMPAPAHTRWRHTPTRTRVFTHAA